MKVNDDALRSLARCIEAAVDGDIERVASRWDDAIERCRTDEDRCGINTVLQALLDERELAAVGVHWHEWIGRVLRAKDLAKLSDAQRAKHAEDMRVHDALSETEDHRALLALARGRAVN